MNALWLLVLWVRGLCLGRVTLATENLALRQQLSVLRRQSRRPQLHDHDRVFWVLMKMLWPRWREVLQIVTPETVVRHNGTHRGATLLQFEIKNWPDLAAQKSLDQDTRA